MILFRPEHADLIREKRKTQTRRLGKRRWNVGAVHLCYTRPAWASPPGTPFARVRILARREERLGDISHGDALAEGYTSVSEYLEAFGRINRIDRPIADVLDQLVWVVHFELVETLA